MNLVEYLMMWAEFCLGGKLAWRQRPLKGTVKATIHSAKEAQVGRLQANTPKDPLSYLYLLTDYISRFCVLLCLAYTMTLMMRFVAPPVFNLLSQRLPPRLRLRHLPPNKPRFHHIEDAERNVTLGLAKATQF